ncbi:hypothetical protein ACHAWF_000229 [Thalassiosira exigua]
MMSTQLERGNHKSSLTRDAKPTVNKLLHEEAKLGYGISTTKACMLKLKGGELYPLGLQHKLTIDKHGKQICKKRQTHDLSNKKKDGQSINQRIDEMCLLACLYDFAFLRYIHLLHHIRRYNPKRRILGANSNIEKSYYRLHTTPKITTKYVTAWTTSEQDEHGEEHEEFICSILTILPFGSSPAPPEFSIFSKTIFDLLSVRYEMFTLKWARL